MKLLFVCTHNRCRSILSEAITRHLAAGKIQAFSAGSQPAGAVHPLTLKFLNARGIDTAGLRSQSWHDFEALQPDAVITVCDAAAGEACPLWMASGIRAHWGLPDPSKIEGDEQAIEAAFVAVMTTIERRIQSVLQHDLAVMPVDTLGQTLMRVAEEVK